MKIIRKFFYVVVAVYSPIRTNNKWDDFDSLLLEIELESKISKHNVERMSFGTCEPLFAFDEIGGKRATFFLQ
jgi:hypothetical protein